MNERPLTELLYKMADDQLILGHRNSEWTGFGPLLEEDIAFSSMAQDKIGHSYALYQLLHQLGEPPPDTIAFMRPAERFHNCQLVELPNGEYDFSLVRHFLYDTAEAIRFEMLRNSSCTPLAEIARKIQSELRYHTLHANTWIRQLATATPESVGRLQASLDFALPYALGIFELSPYESDLQETGIFEGEQIAMARWKDRVTEMLQGTQLELPDWNSVHPILGGRTGQHSHHLTPLLDEMNEVFRIDPTANW